MALSEIFFLAIVFYLLYRFVFHFLVPVVRTTKHVRQQFRHMQGQAGQGQAGSREQPDPRERASHEAETGRPNGAKPVGEYIDFEEVKD